MQLNSYGKRAVDFIQSEEMKLIYEKHGVDCENDCKVEKENETSFVPAYIQFPTITQELKMAGEKK